MREFRDTQGAAWLVFAVTGTAETEKGRRYLPSPYQGGWLVFENGTRKLRLAPIPPGWRELPDDTLRELLANAQPMTPTMPRAQRAYGAPPSGVEEDARRGE